MKLKTEWLPHLRRFRQREIDLVFAGCPERRFGSALELGAGDGSQSRMLVRYVTHLVATDYQPGILAGDAHERIRYEVCDAEEISSRFAGRRFDLIFSSNLLEHLPEPRRVLEQVHDLLSDEGVTIHVMPGPFWKVCHLLLHAPNRLALIIERLTQPKGFAAAARKLRDPERRREPATREQNNPKVVRARRSFWAMMLVPEPHGAEPTHWRELLAFGRSRWRREFAAAGLDLVAIRKGPVASGYGFGLDRARRLLEGIGCASVFIYVAVRKGARRPDLPLLADVPDVR
ncbi:MAG TPA: class I SAM-dependent methyltransferase [Patescibacteria group bacterium]|nr:class I SAM-dependent methyltransferase [Patescibacteria group bacterium]